MSASPSSPSASESCCFPKRMRRYSRRGSSRESRTRTRYPPCALSLESLTHLRRSDADSDVLAEYVIALLKHDGSPEDVRKLCEQEIPDFLTEGLSALPTASSSPVFVLNQSCRFQSVSRRCLRSPQIQVLPTRCGSAAEASAHQCAAAVAAAAAC